MEQGKTRAERLSGRLKRLDAIDRPYRPGQPTAFEVARSNLEDLSRRRKNKAPKEIRVREAFVRTARGASGPPAAELVRGPTSGLQMALLLLFLAQTQPGNSPDRLVTLATAVQDGDIGLCDLICTPPRTKPDQAVNSRTTRRRQQQTVNTALRKVAGDKIALLEKPNRGPGRRGLQPLELFQDVGPRGEGIPLRYSVPEAPEKVVSIPIEFFTQGWILLLSNAELLTYLMYRHALAGGAEFVSGDDRRDLYGVKDSSWEKHRLLSDTGLLALEVDPRRRADGTFAGHSEGDQPMPHRFLLQDDRLQQDALAAVRDAVQAQADGGPGGDDDSRAPGLNARAAPPTKQAAGTREEA